MKSAFEIDYIYEKLASKSLLFQQKPNKIYSKAYTSLIGVMLSQKSRQANSNRL